MVPVLSLVGIIVCMSMIFWHVLKREVVFGTRGSSAAPPMRETAVAGGEIGRVDPLVVTLLEEIDTNYEQVI